MADERRPGAARSFGPNEWVVDDMYEQYVRDPSSVSESWREFFADYRPERPTGDGPAAGRAVTTALGSDDGPGAPAGEVSATPPGPARPGHAAPSAGREAEGARARGTAEAAPDAPAREERPAGEAPAEQQEAPAERQEAPAEQQEEPTEPRPEPLRGAQARIVANMERSLGVPTATSARQVPAKLLEVNRSVINGYLARTRGGKVSFTHLIGYAVVRAIADAMPVMNNSYVEVEGKPHVLRNEHIGMGLAVDVERADGSRTLLVPVIREAGTLDFAGFWHAYEDLIRKVHQGKLTADDMAGATITLTNPGTIGTVHSVPRLMPGQGVIVGVGAIDHPAEFAAADPQRLADLGVSKVITLTSTYDHRIIQGAESGLFLQRVEQLLLGADGFYDDVFASIGVPYEPVRWRVDVNPLDGEQTRLEKQMRVMQLINMYRVRGHLIADLDPLRSTRPEMHPELDPASYGLTIWDLDREFLTGGLAGREHLPLREILRLLRDAYCRTIGIEYMHIQEPEQKAWIQEHVEGVAVEVDADDQRHVLGRLNAAEAFERFLHTRYIGHKRFGIEGAESAIPLLDAVLEATADDGLDGAVLGMAHRGRLNVLANIVGKPLNQIFREFEGDIDPATIQGSGDVKYHLGASGKFVSRKGHELPLELAANPSHLEAVDPVVEGMVRAKQDLIDRPESFSVLPVLLHGDAAFAGQGVVAETLNLSDLRGYRVGGTVHLVINNQLGYTTTPASARSSTYSTDIAKMVQAPIFHVNGDDPEACVRVARLAYDFRQRFHKDVVIDMVCYRRHGHNEGDDPSYTQPLMYKAIEEHRSTRKLYTESLVKRGDISLEEAEQALDDFQERLKGALEETRQSAPASTVRARPAPEPVGVLPRIDTGVRPDVLDRVFGVLMEPPEGFTMHPKLQRQFDQRRRLYEGGEVDWSLAETLAFGSLLAEGTDIRLAGQDSRRGTFSQRHAVLSDYGSGEEYAPLAHLATGQGKFWIYDSLLSEYAAMGFEYGYSVVHKDALVVWEAQFGDFVNGGQVVIDQFIVAAEDKWGQTSGLVLLLPHGFEGQGPEHSSARLERWLTLCAEDNLQVANASTASQYFHLLRRQVRRDVRKPLVVLTPKSMLRDRRARSPVEELTAGSFAEVVDDPAVGDPGAVRRVLVSSGKFAHELATARDEGEHPAAVVRVEQYYPWPGDQLLQVLERYPNAREVVWAQEEPENMGAWGFVHSRLHRALGDRWTLRHVSRFESGSPATGSGAVHEQEQAELLEQAFADL